MHPFLLLSLLPLTFTIAAPTYDKEASRGPSDSVANNANLIQSLIVAPKAIDRLNLLSKDTDFVFDFLNPPPNSSVLDGLGGRAVGADRVSFPALIGHGAAMTVGFLGPCGFNTPHVHPRSGETTVVIEGRLVTQFLLENKARTVTNTLEKLQMTIFPLGSLHTQFNPDCTDAKFVASFSNEDPGTQQEAQAFFGLDPEVVKAAVGNGFAFEGKDVAKFRDLIPKNIAFGVESCLKKCHIVADD